MASRQAPWCSGLGSALQVHFRPFSLLSQGGMRAHLGSSHCTRTVAHTPNPGLRLFAHSPGPDTCLVFDQHLPYQMDSLSSDSQGFPQTRSIPERTDRSGRTWATGEPAERPLLLNHGSRAAGQTTRC